MRMWRLAGLVAVCWAYECSFSTPDGATYDLSSLRKTSPPDYTARVSGLYEYRTNICGPTFQPCNGDTSGVATQWNIDGACVAVLGRQSPVFNGRNPPSLAYLDPKKPEIGVSLKYENGDVCIDVGFIERTVVYNIKCDPSTKGAIVQAIEKSPCQYQIDFTSKAGCPATPEANLNDNSTSQTDKRRVSRGTWLLLTIAVGISLYCGLGIYINKKRDGLELLSSIPNRDFWLEIPSLVREGVSMTVSKLHRWRDTDTEGRVSI